MSTTEIPWGEQKEAGPNEASRESWVIQIFRARDASFPQDPLKISRRIYPPKGTIMREKVCKLTATRITSRTWMTCTEYFSIQKTDHNINTFHQKLSQILESRENTSEIFEIRAHRSFCWKSNY